MRNFPSVEPIGRVGSYGSIIAQLESWKSSYSLNSEGHFSHEYFTERLEIYTKVIFSEHQRIEEGDLILFYIFVEHDMKNDVSPPKIVSTFEKIVSTFDRSKKCRTAYLSVHKSFLDNFRFLINSGIKPYIAVSYLNREEEKDIAITGLYLESEVEIDDFRTC